MLEIGEGRADRELIAGGQAELIQVIEGTAMNPVMVWMVVVLGGFALEQSGDFYRGRVVVRSPTLKPNFTI